MDKMTEFCAHESKNQLGWETSVNEYHLCNCSLSRMEACLLFAKNAHGVLSIQPVSYESGTKRSSGSVFVR